jgi:hypothetical protein
VRCSIGLPLSWTARHLFWALCLVRSPSAASTSERNTRALSDQQVVDEIRGLGDQPLAILADRGEHGLDRFTRQASWRSIPLPRAAGACRRCLRLLTPFYTAFEIVQRNWT